MVYHSLVCYVIVVYYCWRRCHREQGWVRDAECHDEFSGALQEGVGDDRVRLHFSLSLYIYIYICMCIVTYMLLNIM